MKSLALLCVGSVALAASLVPAHAARAATSARGSAHAGVPIRARAGSYGQGNAYLQHGQYVQAVAAFRQAIQQHDHVAQSYAGIGIANIDLRKYGIAFIAYQHAIRIEPKNADFLYGGAFSAVSSHNQSLAELGITYSEHFIALRRNDIKGYIVAFLAYSSLLRYKGELTVAKQIVRLRPNAADSYNYLGIGYANSRILKPAVAAFSRAIQLRPDVTQFWVNRGGVEVVLKEYKLGLSDYQRARSLSTVPVEQKYIDALIKGVHKKMHK